jgi:hypothetical protein
MNCERCGSPAAVKLSSGLVVCKPCFSAIDTRFVNTRFAHNTGERSARLVQLSMFPEEAPDIELPT